MPAVSGPGLWNPPRALDCVGAECASVASAAPAGIGTLVLLAHTSPGGHTATGEEEESRLKLKTGALSMRCDVGGSSATLSVFTSVLLCMCRTSPTPMSSAVGGAGAKSVLLGIVGGAVE